MNLQVNLVLPSEQRSPSLINWRLLLRVMYVLVPACLALLVASWVFRAAQLKTVLTSLEGRRATTEPRLNAAIAVSGQLRTNRMSYAELNGWRDAGIRWADRLFALQTNVPASVQLRQLTVQQQMRLIDDKTPARFFSLVVQGRASGEDAEEEIARMHHTIRNEPTFGAGADSLKVQASADPSPSAVRSDRVFRLDCVFTPKPFNEGPIKPAGRPRAQAGAVE
jgi:hypothetical protein